ncbi:MAG: DUF2249 domain-containing protein [Dehalococcoidia bacterium]
MNTIELDVRGLEPPEPFRLAVEALQKLPAGGQLLLLTDREPMLLFPELVRRGFAWAFDRAPGGDHFTVRIARQTECDD